jgi:predicted TIM-barrel fold metal-dependent hydrolase
MRTPVIDFHVHPPLYDPIHPTVEELLRDLLGSDEAVREMSRTYSDPRAMVEQMRANGIDRAVMLAEYCPLVTGVVSNDAIAGYCRDHAQLIPFCSFNPYEEPDMPGSLRRCHAAGFKGLKLYPSYNHFHLNEIRMYPLYAVAQELGMPVLVHTGTSVFRNTRLKYANPVDVDDVAVDFPDLTILMAHGGRMAWYDEAMTMARLHKHVYIELSGLAVKKLLRIFPDMERFSHKFVFGTDWPQVDPARNIAVLRGLGLSREALERILGGNAARILGLESAV